MGSISVISIIIVLIGLAILSYGLIDIYIDDKARKRMKRIENDMSNRNVKPRMRSGMIFNKKTGKLEEDISVCPSHYRNLSQGD